MIKLHHDEDIGAICKRYMNLSIAYNVPRYNGVKRAAGRSYLSVKNRLNLTSLDVLDIVNKATQEGEKGNEN